MIDAEDPAPQDDAERLERAWAGIRSRGALRDGLRVAREVAAAAETRGDRALRARALHVLGHGLSRLRRLGRAVAVLLEAADLYHVLGDDRGRANVYDTLGQAYATRGRLEQALHFYSLSLVDKAALGDRAGLAVTIGNIGRIHLRSGLYGDAIQCFERDLEIATETGDLRGQARMHEDLGRAWAGLEEDAKAEEAFRRCLAIAEPGGYQDIVFYAHLDLAALRLRQGRVEDAVAEVDRACATGLDREVPYFALLLDAARLEVRLAQGDDEALAALEPSLARLARADLPDVELPVRLRAAHMLVERGDSALAERVLLAGVRRARGAGYARYLPAFNEAMTALRLKRPPLEETGRRRRSVAKAAGAPTGDAPTDGAYVTLERLGQGAYGEVFRAWDPVRSREVALKLVHLERVYDLGLRERLLTSVQVELEAAGRVRHPGIARVYAIGREEDGGFYVVQEYVRGPSLRLWMEDTPEPPPATVTRLVGRLASALAALNEAGVVHRDLKPENVLLRTDESPVLVDFGIAHLEMEGTPLPLAAGTLEYMAPEQARGDPVDGRADLYALGVLAFEWLVGFRPLQLGGRPTAEWQRVLEEQIPPRVREFRPDVPEALDDLVAALLAKRAEDRPADAREVARRCAALSLPTP